MRVARVFGGLGRLLIWAGAIVLLFVAYQLWGTGLAEARAQGDLEDDFDAFLEQQGVADLVDVTPTTAVDVTAPQSTTTTRPLPPPPPPDDGQAVARIKIPAIDVDKIVVEGVGRGDLQKGPGHYPGTPLPGQPGNASIAGHRTTYGAPFNRVDELVPGDEILVTTAQGTFRYLVTGQEIVDPTRVDVIEDQGDNRLTLTSCHPKYSAALRIIITAELSDEAAPAPPPAPEVAVPDPVDSDDNPVLAAPELDQISLDGEDADASVLPTVLWASITGLVWLAFYALSREWRRIPSYLLGAPVFGVSLFITFGAITELLPSNF